jgi:uncharacterized protein YgiM (DUF1202 family)
MIARVQGANLWLQQILIAVLVFAPFSQAQAEWFGSDWFAEQPLQQVSVNDAFINVYSGPGRGYPIFHVVERDEVITLLKSRTDWIKIETKRGLVGWIKRDDMQYTLALDGSKPDFPDSTQADYLVNRVEMGAAYGDFAGADSLTLNLGYRFTKNLSAEFRIADNTGQFSDSRIMAGAVLFQPFPEWRVSPFFSLGSGTIETYPSSTLVQTEDRKDDLMQAGLGAYVHLTGRFFLRAEYTNHYVLTSRNTNEEVNEWKLGFSVFF